MSTVKSQQQKSTKLFYYFHPRLSQRGLVTKDNIMTHIRPLYTLNVSTHRSFVRGAFVVVYLICISTNEECKPYVHSQLHFSGLPDFLSSSDPPSVQQETEEPLSRSSPVVCSNSFYFSYQGACSPVLTGYMVWTYCPDVLLETIRGRPC